MPETLAVQTMPHPTLRVFPSRTGCTCGMPDWDTMTLEGGDCRSIGCDPRCPSCSYVDECSATGYPAGSSERERCEEPAVVCVPDDSSDSGDREGYCADHAVTYLPSREDTGRWDG